MKIISNQGREIEMELYRSVIYLDVFKDYRQQTEVYLRINGLEFAGFSYLNPRDIFDEDKGVKAAVKDALQNGAYNIVIDDKDVRQDIWQAVFQMTEAQKAIAGIKAMNDYETKYGPKALFDILPNERKEEVLEITKFIPFGDMRGGDELMTAIKAIK